CDGIRAFRVTGVQTCALPISVEDLPVHARDTGSQRAARELGEQRLADAATAVGRADIEVLEVELGARREGREREEPDHVADGCEIGRASCRERVKIRRAIASW